MSCNEADGNQRWEQVGTGNRYVSAENVTAGTRAFYNPSTQRCLDVINNTTSNGSVVGTWSCHFGDNQQSY